MMTNPNDPINPEPRCYGVMDKNLSVTVRDIIIPGLTKREYFAALALQGILSFGSNGEWTVQDGVRGAVRWADALIAELNKQE